MKVHELIATLGTLPREADVQVVWDGAARSDVRHAYLSRKGSVMLADAGEVVYDDADRPETAPSVAEARYWRTPGEKAED